MVRVSWLCVCAADGAEVVRRYSSVRHIDGQDYFWAVSEILDSAKDVIFILVGLSATLDDFLAEQHGQDWWLSPELYLR